jgi:tetratricopeptide (TPR) repeat protein
MRHFNDDELAQYAFDPEGSLLSDQIEQHILDCPICEAQLSFIRTIDEGLKDEESWDISNAIGGSIGDAPDVTSLVELAARVESEDAEAVALLAPFLESPLRFGWADVSRKERFRTPGVVRVLCHAALAACEKNPLHALDLADAAVGIAEELPADYYPARAIHGLRGLAWKDRANALRYLGRYGDALASLDESERAYRLLRASSLELAVVDFVRATVLVSGDRFDDALVCVRRCAPVFREHREEVRYRHSRLLEATVLFMLRDLQAARPILIDLLAGARLNGDPMLTGRAAHNLGLVELDLGELAEAKDHLSLALRIYDEIGVSTEATRTRWSLARLAAASGELDDALLRFRAVREEFARKGITVDEALVALDMADLLLATGNSAAAGAIAAELFGTFRAAGMVTSTLTALGFLHEAAATGRLTPKVVQHVRVFLERSQRQPELLFAPPPGE